MKTSIRDERPEDIEVIYSIVRGAFAGREYADGDEQELVNDLRRRDALSVSLVAETEREVVGHIAFSPAEASDGSGPWFALAPVSVRPDLQLKGIGSDLINEGLKRIRAKGAVGCILVGNPDYYCRFGFALAPEHVPEGQPEAYFQMLCFTGHLPAGPVQFHRAFDELGQH